MSRADEAGPDDHRPRHRIGEVAALAEVSTRTLRYYQELGLIQPSGSSPGGSRRYSDADVARLRRVLELRNVMGFELDRIGPIVDAEDRLAQLRQEVATGVTKKRRAEIVTEAIAINADLRAQVTEKLAVLHEFDAELRTKAARYRAVAAELGIEVADQPRAGAEVPGRPTQPTS
jgi:DNA-binding transcriptional MerR regulator